MIMVMVVVVDMIPFWDHPTERDKQLTTFCLSLEVKDAKISRIRAQKSDSEFQLLGILYVQEL